MSENHVMMIIKEYVKELLNGAEQQDENTFICIPSENYHINDVLFSVPDMAIPADYSNYMNEYGLLCGLLDCVPDDTDKLESSALANSLYGKYKFILDNCNLDNTHQSAEDASALDAATRYLYDENGVLSDNFRRYIQFKEEIINLKNQLRSDQSTASSLSAAEFENWKQGAKKDLEYAIETTEQLLLIEGKQTEVENHIAVYEKLQRSHPAVIVERLKKRIDDLERSDISLLGNGSYLPIQPSPALHSIEVWQHATIAQKDVLRIQKALNAVDKNHVVDLDLRQIDFQWCSVYLMREWFDSTFFESSFWKMPHNQLVSEGKRPNSGILPCYVKRVVLSRNVIYKAMRVKAKPAPRKKVSARAKITLNPRRSRTLATMGLRNSPRRLRKSERSTSKLNSTASGKKSIPLRQRRIEGVTIKPANLALLNSKFLSMSLANQALVANKQTTKKITTKKYKSMNKVVNKNIRSAVPQQALNLKRYLSHRSFTDNIKISATSIDKKLQSKRLAFKHPLILSFICKRVPHCPTNEVLPD